MPNVEYKELGWTDMVNIKLTENEINQIIKEAICPRCGQLGFIKLKDVALYSTSADTRIIAECPCCGYRRAVVIEKTRYFEDNNR